MKILKNKIFILLALPLILSCMNNNSKIEILKKEITEKGDEKSYIKFLSLCENTNSIDLLSYSIIMADKYDYGAACYSVHREVIKLSFNGKYNLSEIVNLGIEKEAYCLYYLKKGSELNNVSCISTLLKYYKIKGLDKNQDYINLKIKYDSIIKTDSALLP